MSQDIYNFNGTKIISVTRLDFMNEWVETNEDISSGLPERIESLEAGARFASGRDNNNEGGNE